MSEKEGDKGGMSQKGKGAVEQHTGRSLRRHSKGRG